MITDTISNKYDLKNRQLETVEILIDGLTHEHNIRDLMTQNTKKPQIIEGK